MHHDEKPYFPARPVNWPGLHPANTTVRGLKFRNTLHQGRDVLQPHPRKYDRVPLENHRIDTSTPYPSLNGIHAPHCHVDDLYQKARLANPWCVSHCYILVCRYVSVFASPAATALNMNPGFQPSPGHATTRPKVLRFSRPARMRWLTLPIPRCSPARLMKKDPFRRSKFGVR